MLNVSAISENIRKELGFPLCEKDNQIIHNEELICIGTKCSIVPSKDCGSLKHAGFFHSHTRGAFPSFSDLMLAYKTGLLCIGQNDGQNANTIFCHERKSIEYDPKVYNDILQKGQETKKDIDEQIPKRIIDKKIILHNYFNTIVFRKKNDTNIIVSDYEYR